MLRTITETSPPLPLEELLVAIKDFSSASLDKKKALITRLVASHPILNLKWGPRRRYRRARLLSPTQQLSTVDEITWPKGVPAPLGRANPAGFPVFYLADHPDTALCEVGAKDGPAMLADFEILPGRTVQVAPIGELRQIQRAGRGYLSGDASSPLLNLINACDLDEAKSLLITDAFLLKCLIGPNKNYELTSCVAKSIFDKLPSVSVVAFPSRRQLGAINFVVRVERFWDDWGVSAVRRGHAVHLALGYYEFTNIRHVSGITAGGSLQWSHELDVEKSIVLLRPLWTPTLPR